MSASVSPSRSQALARLGIWRRRGRRGGAEPRGPAASGPAAARILSARTQEREVRLNTKDNHSGAVFAAPGLFGHLSAGRILRRCAASRAAMSGRAIEPAEVPEPYRSLLVHQSDMTSTLENFYREQLHIEVLARHARRERIFPRSGAGAGPERQSAVEFGAIKIMLDLFPVEARQEILREQQPLGRILNRFGIAFASRPRGFCAWRRMISSNAP